MSRLATRRGWPAALVLTLMGVVLGSLAALVPTTAHAETPAPQPGQAIVYLFWGDGCPHCAAAKPVIAEMAARHPGMVVKDFEIYRSPANRELFAHMAARHGFEPSGVPTLLLGDRHWVGWVAGRTDADLERAVTQCLATGCPDAGAGLVAPLAPPPSPSVSPAATPPVASAGPVPSAAPPASDTTVDVPFLGRVDLAQESLVVTTLLIAFVDGFNPCSLWVLTILLALALRTGSRRLTLLIGAVFILVTGLVYALFIAGIFSVLSVIAISPWVRVLVALVAGVFGLVNVKDFFAFKQGPSLTIPDSAKPGIYARIRAITHSTDNIPALVVGTAALAAGVSVIELACTAGFPVIWSNILTTHRVGAATFAALLLLYMLVYQLDELAVFGAAVVTLRASKLQERHGRLLKLAGGMLMLTLAVVMVVDPNLMNGLGTSLAVFAAAVIAALAVWLVDRLVRGRG